MENNEIYNFAFKRSGEANGPHQSSSDSTTIVIKRKGSLTKKWQESEKKIDKVEEKDKTKKYVKYMTSLKDKNSEKNVVIEKSNGNVHVIDKASRYIFPVSFLFLNIFYFLYSFILYQAI